MKQMMNLPLCTAVTDISSALALMHEAHSSAVAIFRGQDFRVVTEGELAVARHHGSKSIAEVAAMSLAADQPVDLWIGSSAAQAYQARLSSRDLNILAPSPMDVPAIMQLMESQLFGPSGMVRINWQIVGPSSPRRSLRAPTPVLDDIISGRFDHPRLDVWVTDDVATVLGTAPRDYYCDGTPRHNNFPAPVSAGQDCPYAHKPPAQIVSSR